MLVQDTGVVSLANEPQVRPTDYREASRCAKDERWALPPWRLRARVCRADALAMAVVAGCVIFHRRQLLLRELRIPPPSFCFFDRSRFFASRSPSSFTLRFATAASAVAAVAVPRLSLFLSFPRALPGVASLSFSPSVANIRNVCRGHATGHQLHDLRFADLASRVHRHTGMRSGAAHEGHACVRSRVHMHARDTQTARDCSQKWFSIIGRQGNAKRYRCAFLLTRRR